jgi:hypothetical protein
LPSQGESHTESQEQSQFLQPPNVELSINIWSRPIASQESGLFTRVIIGDYRIDVLANVVQCVSENKRFIANAGDSDQKVLMTQ